MEERRERSNWRVRKKADQAAEQATRVSFLFISLSLSLSLLLVCPSILLLTCACGMEKRFQGARVCRSASVGAMEMR